MDSLGNPQNNRIPYIDATSKDCTQGICSLYCPQWCYPAFPPPIQFLGGDDTSSSGPNFSPLLIAIIGVLAGAFLLVTYYTVVSKFCRRSSDPYGTESARGVNPSADGDPSPGTDHEPWYVSTGGLDEALIRSIAVCKYKRGSGMIEGTCSVCLSEFQDGESVRLLPNCTHAFHIICIDTWLTSHSNCPLCRSEVAPTGSFPVLIPLPYDVQLPGNESCRESDNRIDPGTASANPRTSSSDVPPQGEATGNGNLAVKSQSVRISRDACNIGRADTVIDVQHEELQPIRRSFSTGHLCRAVADTLKADQINEEDQIQDSTGSSTNHDAGSVKNYSCAKLGTGGTFSTV